MDESVPIDAVLSKEQLEALRRAYKAPEMTEFLSRGIPGLDQDTFDYIHTIRTAFYDRTRMVPKDRERCLIGILASRDAGLNLALHVYVGLMEYLEPIDVADVIFLCGIYAGVDRLSDGLAAEMRTLTVLARVASGQTGCGVEPVVKALIAAFRPPFLLPSSP